MTKQQIEAFKKITPGPWERHGGSIIAKWDTGERATVALINFPCSTMDFPYAPEARSKRYERNSIELRANGETILALPDLLAEREKMIEMLKEMREATAAAFRVMAKFPETSEIFEIEFRGIEPGFGARCQKLIAEAEGGE